MFTIDFQIIITYPLAPKVQWSVIGLNKPQRQTESSVTCRSTNHLSTAFCLQPIDPPAPKSSFLNPLLLYLNTQNSRKKDAQVGTETKTKVYVLQRMLKLDTEIDY